MSRPPLTTSRQEPDTNSRPEILHSSGRWDAIKSTTVTYLVEQPFRLNPAYVLTFQNVMAGVSAVGTNGMAISSENWSHAGVILISA